MCIRDSLYHRDGKFHRNRIIPAKERGNESSGRCPGAVSYTHLYNYYASKKWGDASSYNLCINSSCTGVEGAVHIIQEFAKVKQEHLKSIAAK